MAALTNGIWKAEPAFLRSPPKIVPPKVGSRNRGFQRLRLLLCRGTGVEGAGAEALFFKLPAVGRSFPGKDCASLYGLGSARCPRLLFMAAVDLQQGQQNNCKQDTTVRPSSSLVAPVSSNPQVISSKLQD